MRSLTRGIRMLVMVTACGLPQAAAHQPPITDMAALERRIADTGAVGLFTKLSIKKDATALYDAIGKLHAGTAASTLEELRERYDLLVHKIIVLLEKKDAALARDIASAREALWETLSDPVRFRAL